MVQASTPGLFGSKALAKQSMPKFGDATMYGRLAEILDAIQPSALQLPLLFADCEGFEGGEKVPLGSQSRKRGKQGSVLDEVSVEVGVVSRPIQWANTEETRRREYAVTALYPRPMCRAVVPRLCAAFTRSTIMMEGGDIQPSLDASNYYQNSPTNWYSKLVHEYEIDGKGYAFP